MVPLVVELGVEGKHRTSLVFPNVAIDSNQIRYSVLPDSRVNIDIDPMAGCPTGWVCHCAYSRQVSRSCGRSSEQYVSRSCFPGDHGRNLRCAEYLVQWSHEAYNSTRDPTSNYIKCYACDYLFMFAGKKEIKRRLRPRKKERNIHMIGFIFFTIPKRSSCQMPFVLGPFGSQACWFLV